MSLLLNKETKKVWAFTVHSTFILSEFTIHNIVYYGNLVLGPSSFDPFYFGDQTLFPINSVLTMFFFSFLLSFFFILFILHVIVYPRCQGIFRG